MVLAVLIYVGLVIGSFVLILVGLVTVSEGFDRYEERTVIRDWPVSSLDAIALGKTAIAGTVQPDGEPVTVPFGGREEALVYEVTVEDTNKVETAHVDERVAPPFFLETDDGRVRVDASELRLDLSADREWSREVESHEEIPPDLAKFARKRGLPDQGLDRDREFAYEYLAPGDEVFVYGRAIPDDERGSADEKAVLVTAHEGKSGFVSDKSRETLLDERRRPLAKALCLGVVEAVVGLAAFLWLTGIAQILLGA